MVAKTPSVVFPPPFGHFQTAFGIVSQNFKLRRSAMTVKNDYKIGDKVRLVLPKTPENHKAYLYPPDALAVYTLKVGDVCIINDTGRDTEYHLLGQKTYQLYKYTEDGSKYLSSWWVTAEAIAYPYTVEEECDAD